ncbi:MAG: hypothetical protein HC919_08715 [Oscillatoriales cyanobacterium SM2_2_1]|nr:hypothetical protein [Oscillatoriales cyanobacterium SM2_2_1]
MLGIAPTLSEGWRGAMRQIRSSALLVAGLILLAAVPHLESIPWWFWLGVGAAVGLGTLTRRAIRRACQWNSFCELPRSLVLVAGAGWWAMVATANLSLHWLAVGWCWIAAHWLTVALVLTWGLERDGEAIPEMPLGVMHLASGGVVLSPLVQAQQPRQWSCLLLLLLAPCYWLFLPLPTAVKPLLVGVIALTGLIGVSTWQVRVELDAGLLRLNFGGWWGLGRTYVISLRGFSKLGSVRVHEQENEMQWLQLSGTDGELTLPLAIAGISLLGESEQGFLGDQLREAAHLARHDRERDSLGLVSVVLPQGAGILAAVVLIATGAGVLLLLPVTVSPSLGLQWLLGCCVLAPAASYQLWQLLAPQSLLPAIPEAAPVPVGMIGLLLLLVSTPREAPVSLLIGWLALATGACLVTHVRRSPLLTPN